MKRTYSYMHVYQDIRGAILAGDYPPGAQLPTEATLQEQYGISRITVKKAMELLTADALIERFPGKGTFVKKPAQSAQAMDTQAQSGLRIGVVMSDFSSEFGQNFLRGVAEEANRQGCGLMVGLCYATLEEENALIRRFREHRVDGIIAMAIHSEVGINTGIMNCAIEGFPLILADRYLEGVALPYVGSDHADAAFRATEYLFRLGHTNIGLISSAPTTTAITERESGYMRAYAMTQYRVHPSYLIPDIRSSMPGQHTQENIRLDIERMKTYYRENPEVTALLCIDYHIMKICEAAANECGIRIPQQLSLLCFDAPDQSVSGQTYTHIRQPERQIGVQSVQMLLDVIHGNRDPQYRLLPTELCVGASTAERDK